MYRIFPRVYFFVMCCNIGIFMLGSAFGSTIIQDPFTNSTSISVDETDFPNIYNGTDPSGTLYANFTNPTNQTGAGGGGEPFQFIPDYFEIPFTVLYTIIQFISGGYVFAGIALFGFPTYATAMFQLAIAFWGVYTMAYYILGRG